MDVKIRRWQYLRLMHFPLPLCVFSFATLGAVVSPTVYFDRLLWTYLIVFASLCLASYSFDELRGRPLHTTIPRNHLRALGWTGVAASVFVGIYLAITVSPVLLAWIPPSGFVILAYNMELFNGRFHNATTFALGWGGIPTVGSFFLQTLTISIVAILVGAAVVVFSLAIWTLTHDLRGKIDTLQEIAGNVPSDVMAIRHSARRMIWKITRVLCYSITLFTIALSYFRFFP